VQIALVESGKARCGDAVALALQTVAGEAGIGRAARAAPHGDDLAGRREGAVGLAWRGVTSRQHDEDRQGERQGAHPDRTQANGPGSAIIGEPHGSERIGIGEASEGRMWDHRITSRFGQAAQRPCLASALVVCVILAGCKDTADLPRPVVQVDPALGLRAMERVGCAACHDIPGVNWPRGRTGSSLAGMGSRPMIAGRLPNQPEILADFVRDAPALAPDIGMPAMPLDATEARHVAAYLYTLQDE
jgi:sulfur-oxidizing protein SoxX